MRKLICEGKYFIAGLHGDAIGLAVDIPDLPETIEANGLTLHRKSSFHVTLFPVGKMIEKHGIQIHDFLSQVEADFCGFTKNNPIDIVSFRDEFRFVSEKERRTVVRMCEVSNIKKFYDLINGKYNLEIKYPPTHVTLYTLQLDAGIYLTDQKEIENLSKPIENPGIAL